MKSNLLKLWRFEDESNLLIEVNKLHILRIDLSKYPDDERLAEILKRQWNAVNRLQSIKNGIVEKASTLSWDDVYKDMCEIFGEEKVNQYLEIYI